MVRRGCTSDGSSYHTWFPGSNGYNNHKYRYAYAQLPTRNTIRTDYDWKPVIHPSKCLIANKNVSPNNDPGLDALINIIAHEVIESFHSWSSWLKSSPTRFLLERMKIVTRKDPGLIPNTKSPWTSARRFLWI